MIACPARYILQVYTDFEHKQLLAEAIRNLKAVKGEDYELPSTLYLGLRMLIAWKQYRTIPWCEIGHLTRDGTEEDMWFMNKVLSYYSQLQLDDFHSWTPS